jgi:hypothetical protein
MNNQSLEVSKIRGEKIRKTSKNLAIYNKLFLKLQVTVE